MPYSSCVLVSKDRLAVEEFPMQHIVGSGPWTQHGAVTRIGRKGRGLEPLSSTELIIEQGMESNFRHYFQLHERFGKCQRRYSTDSKMVSALSLDAIAHFQRTRKCHLSGPACPITGKLHPSPDRCVHLPGM